MLNYYEILGITRSSTTEEIKSAYKKLAVKYHPDKNPGDAEAEKKFVEVNEANENLVDPEKRRIYDSKTNSSFMFNFYADMFSDGIERPKASDFINTGRMKKEPPPGEGISLEVGISIEEIAMGCFREMKYKRRIHCRFCAGTGSSTHKTCHKCLGKGLFVNVIEGRKIGEDCPNCSGSGLEADDQCKECKGKGFHLEDYSTRIDIPRGVADAAILEFIGKGHAGKGGGPYGKLSIKVIQLNHKVFTREAFDLTCSVDITYCDLILGTKIKVPTLGSPVDMEISPLTKTDVIFRLKDRGLVNRSGDIRGSILVSLNLLVPDAISDEQKELYVKLRETEQFII